MEADANADCAIDGLHKVSVPIEIVDKRNSLYVIKFTRSLAFQRLQIPDVFSVHEDPTCSVYKVVNSDVGEASVEELRVQEHMLRSMDHNTSAFRLLWARDVPLDLTSRLAGGSYKVVRTIQTVASHRFSDSGREAFMLYPDSVQSDAVITMRAMIVERMAGSVVLRTWQPDESMIDDNGGLPSTWWPDIGCQMILHSGQGTATGRLTVLLTVCDETYGDGEASDDSAEPVFPGNDGDGDGEMDICSWSIPRRIPESRYRTSLRPYRLIM